ncbi:MAG: hypothetical protein P9M03_02160 [Candidatus Theseobacter exili]|nr:hypothetical protein [Candidatus Theseobacter exili]
MDSSIPAISKEHICKFRIDGLNDFSGRPAENGNLFVFVAIGEEVEDFNKPESKILLMLKSVKKSGAKVAIIAISDLPVNHCNLPEVDCLVFISLKEEDPLNISKVLLLKIILNSLSTIAMSALGRVYSNFMTHVSPSNKKLIDRATRIISCLTGAGYEEANSYLFDVMKFSDPELRKGKELPPPVHIAVARIKNKIGNKAAVELLAGKK